MKRALLVIDMQNVYAKDAAWATPGFAAALDNILLLCQRYKERIFTRHLPFLDPPGRWRQYNHFARKINEDKEAQLLVSELRAVEHQLFDKYTYSALASGALKDYLLAKDFDEILICGVQTEFCVLATLLEAVDLGLPVTLVADACAGSLPIFNAAIISLVKRMPEQAEIKYTQELIYG